MKKIYLVLIIIISINIFGENKVLNSVDIVNLLLENNNTIKLANSGTNLAKAVYDQVINSGKPSLSFTTDSFSSPLVSYNNLVPGVDTYSVAGGLAYKQLLPTGGNINAIIKDSFKFSDNSKEVSIKQSLGFDLTLVQPIFVNNKFIDLDFFKNSKRSSSINYNLSKIDQLETKNQVITGVLSSIHMINVLRKNLEVLNKSIILAEKRVIMAQEDRLNGRISTSELLSIELNVGKQKETLFDISYQLETAELNLQRVLGIDNIQNIIFDLEIEDIDKKIDKNRSPSDDLNFNEYRTKLKLEQSELNYNLNRLSEAPVLSMFIKTNTKDLEKDFDMNINLGLAVQIGIFDGGIKKNKILMDEISIDIARNNYIEASNLKEENSRVLNSKIALLKEKLLLVKANIDYDRVLIERERDLQTLGLSTTQDVELVEMNLLNREIDLFNIYGEMYLTYIQIVSLNGGNIEEFIRF